MLDANNSVLIVVDVQGRLAEVVYQPEELMGNVQRLIASAKPLEVPVLVTEQLPDKLGPTRDELFELLTSSQVISKSSFSCCGEPKFVDALKGGGKKQVVLCGIEAHICITQTALDLMEQGMEVFVVADAISSRNKKNKKMAIERLRQHGAEIVVSEMVIFEWLRDAAHPAFREVRQFLA